MDFNLRRQESKQKPFGKRELNFKSMKNEFKEIQASRIRDPLRFLADEDSLQSLITLWQLMLHCLLKFFSGMAFMSVLGKHPRKTI